MLMASSGAAQAFSTSIGGMIAAVAPWRLAFPVLGVLAGVSTAFLYAHRMHEIRVPREPGRPPPRYRDALRARGMLTLLALVAVEGALYIGGFSFLSGLVAQRFGFSALEIGLLLSLTGVAQLISARLLPHLLRRTGERSLLLGGGAAMTLAYLISARADSWPWIALSCLLLGSGFSLCHTTLQTRATELLPSGRGTALALFAFSLFSGNAIGTIGAGYAVDALGYGITFGGLGVMMLAFTTLLSRLVVAAPQR
jgi:predicted MFS family arabinose efflux permease